MVRCIIVCLLIAISVFTNQQVSALGKHFPSSKLAKKSFKKLSKKSTSTFRGKQVQGWIKKRKLSANTKFVDNGITYEYSNTKGGKFQVEKVSGKITKDKLDFAPPSDPLNEVTVGYKNSYKFDRGHLVARQHGGTSDPINIEAQPAAFNRNGGWRRSEEYTNKLLEDPKVDSVDMEIEITKRDKLGVPTEYKKTLTARGKSGSIVPQKNKSGKKIDSVTMKFNLQLDTHTNKYNEVKDPETEAFLDSHDFKY